MFRKLFRWVSQRFRRRDAGRSETGTMPGNTSMGMAVSQDAATSGGREIRFQARDDSHSDEILETLRVSFGIGEIITSALPFPGSDLVFGVLTGFVERVQIIKENNETKKELLNRLSSLSTSILEADPSQRTTKSLPAFNLFKSQVVDQLQLCKGLAKPRNFIARFIFAEFDKKKFEAFDASISKAIEDLSLVVHIRNANALDVRYLDGLTLEAVLKHL
ncbi:hypothetical protein SCHPADRAFT_756826 [Schizopora paradoxa]|uniref:Uncharacterized protein n=1 Tax=Schizopora paradoxa TaxID=27342 RepID=A0A0H2QY51_9AGAM|nr:hypothetical protein SCHPADRAFT_756826 [Schizopora paradoxa]